LPWSLELIERFEELWDWDSLSRNEGLPWSLELIERFEERWHWGKLSRNKSLPWSLDLIEHFKEWLDWGAFSWNEGLPWSLELMERFEARWNWEYLFARNRDLPTLRPADIVAIMEFNKARADIPQPPCYDIESFQDDIDF